jgi:hypothetical protein
VTSQLELLEPEPRPLSPRQQAVLDKLHAAGIDGLTPAEAGAYVHWTQGRHAYSHTCQWCAHAGNEVLGALRKRGFARQRGRPRVWVAVGVRDDTMPPGMTTEIPF